MPNGLADIDNLSDKEYRLYSFMELNSIKKDINSINDKFKVMIWVGIPSLAVILAHMIHLI